MSSSQSRSATSKNGYTENNTQQVDTLVYIDHLQKQCKLLKDQLDQAKQTICELSIQRSRYHWTGVPHECSDPEVMCNCAEIDSNDPS